MTAIIIQTIIAILEMSPVLSIAAFGQLLSQKSGVFNLGIEGIMASGAVFAVLGYSIGLGPWLSLLFGFLIGALFGMLLSLLSEKLKLNQIVVGFGLWFLALGLAGSVYAMILAPQKIDIKPIDPVLFSLDPVFYLSIVIFIFLGFFFSMTRQGLAVKAVGENPRAADTAGIDVEKVRLICNVTGSGLIGLSGAYLAIDILQGFTYTMVSGYGWIAFALVIFGRWETHYVFLGSFVFVSTTAIATRLGILGIQILPPSYVVYLPHIAVIVALTLTMMLGKKMGMPAALGHPYER